jgi:hypothetical protein
MVRKSYVIPRRDLRIRPRNRPGPGEPEPEYPENPTIPGPEDPYPPEDGEGDYEDAIHPPPPHIRPAPGLYVGPTKGNPVIPVPSEPEEGEGEHLKLPPGAIWPKRARGRVAGNYVALAYVPEHGWHYVVIDPDAWPDWPEKENGDEPTAPSRPGTQPGAPGGRPTPSRG